MELFGADLRSLAAFRILLAALALVDLATRARNLSVHYTDRGVLPRYALLEELPRRWSFSLHLISGDLWIQAALFLIAGLAAVAMLLGFKTRLATVIVWLFMMSLHTRNPLVNSGADVLLRVLFFWAMFLPLGAYWSLDIARAAAPRRASPRYFSFGTVGLFAQLVFVYVFTVILKSGPEWRTDGTAIYYALSLDQLVTPIGTYLYQFPELMRAMTIGTFWFEALGPLLLFSPIFTGQLRTAAVLGFMSLHLGIWLTMSIGLFPWVSSLAMVCFLPAWFWDTALVRLRSMAPLAGHYFGRWPRRLQTPISRLGVMRTAFSISQQTASSGAPASAHGWFTPFIMLQSRLRRPLLIAGMPGGLDMAPAAGSIDPAPIRRDSFRPETLSSSVGLNLLAIIAIAVVFCWNLSTVSDFDVPTPLRETGLLLRLDQKWNLFAPYPDKSDGWFIIPGTLRGGTQLDLMPVTRGDFKIHEGVTEAKPRRVSDIFRDKSWRKYMTGIETRRNEDMRLYFGKYICREWNARYQGSEQLTRFQLYLIEERTLPDYRTAEPRKIRLWSHRCF